MKKIIITTIAVAIILCLGIATLVMALIPVGMNDKVAVPDEIYIYTSQTNSLANKRIELRHRDGETDINKINKIYNLFDSAFQQNALSALFSGELKYTTTSDHTEVSKSISKNFSSEDKITLVFYFKNERTVEYENQEYKYKYLFFEITNENSRHDVVMGLNKSIPSDESDYPVENMSYYYSYKSKANFADLYKYVSQIITID